MLDDIDLPRGKIRYRASGSGGTHNGLKNIVNVIKSEDIARLRVGIGKDDKLDLKDYVLSKIDPYAMQEISPFAQPKRIIMEKTSPVSFTLTQIVSIATLRPKILLE